MHILNVEPGSHAASAGITAGCDLLSLNGEPVLDEIDYQALIAHRTVRAVWQDPAGTQHSAEIRKHDWEPLGLTLDESAVLKPRSCKNRCVFCFIDQMPPHMRDTLYVKDDDWRLSLMMGNYVTLTNVDDAEFSRIIRRQVSPLYISVHATDPEVRVRMMANPRAGELMDRLKTLAAHGISFHCQIVLCPGWNDGAVLEKSILELSALYPAARSVALVPVGLTGYREGLPALKGYDAGLAAALLDSVIPQQEAFLERFGTRFVFPSDEFYCLSGRDIPPEENFEDYPQIENGVGMLRQLEREMQESLEWDDPEAPKEAQHLLIATGVSAAPFIREMCRRYAPENTKAEVFPIVNRFFGESVTVTGLITGGDLVEQMKGRKGDRLLISGNMLREGADVFLDDMTVQEVSESLSMPVCVVQNNGAALLKALYGHF